MIRHHRGAPRREEEDDDDDDDEDDVFSSLSRKPSAKEASKHPVTSSGDDSKKKVPIVPSTTSSMKRHHGQMSNSRKAQMDALIQELQFSDASNQAHHQPARPRERLYKMGSFVEAEESYSTTNLFVGNLAPSLTERDVVDMFSRFGPLHSVKIMWPRTAEEASRNRITGFVSFHERSHAEDALHECNDRDPFRVGRRLMVRWASNVLNEQPRSDRRLPEVNKRPRMANSAGAAGERAKGANSTKTPRKNVDHVKLDEAQLREFEKLTRQELCSSRHAICRAMAFCFQYPRAAEHLCELLKKMMLSTDGSVDTKVARLYLLSDILYNSQQPGVRNAYRFRDAIEKMAHEVFSTLGRCNTQSRMTLHKLRTAVRAVLAAWTSWGVFDASFMDELEAKFEGREIFVEKAPVEDVQEEKTEAKDVVRKEVKIFSARDPVARSDFVDVDDEDEQQATENEVNAITHRVEASNGDDVKMEDIDGEPLEEGDLTEDGLRRLKAIHAIITDDERPHSDGGEAVTDVPSEAKDYTNDSDSKAEATDQCCDG